MYYKFLLLLLTLLPIICSAQSSSLVTLSNEKPEAGEVVKFKYSNAEDGVSCIAFLSGLYQEDPLALDITLTKDGESWCGFVPTQNEDRSFLLVFYDSLGNHDNNEEQGYWWPLHSKSGEVLPGAYATFAHMLCGPWDASIYKLTRDRQRARMLYEKDFNKYPDLKRYYYRHYISSISYHTDQKDFLRELKTYSVLQDLTEWELLDLSKKYSAINDSISSKAFEMAIFEQYPNGCWSKQVSSLPFQKEFLFEKNFENQLAIFQRFKNTFDSVEVDCSKRYIDGIKTTIFLRRLILPFVEKGRLNDWKLEAESLHPRMRSLAYSAAAQYLVQHNRFPKVTVELAKESAQWMMKNLDSPREPNDRAFSTDRQVRESRSKTLAECLHAQASGLMLLNQHDSAETVLWQAVEYSQRKDSKINQLLIECLIKNKKEDHAFIEISRMEKAGGSNEKIMEMYRKILNGKGKRNRNNTVLPPANGVTLTNFESPPLEFYDEHGNEIAISSYSNKIVVLDFWATWCAPCIAGFENMNRIKERYAQEENVVFLFVVCQDKSPSLEEKVKSLLESLNYKFAVLYDKKGVASSGLNFNSLPTKFVIDSFGKVRYKNSGAGSESDIEKVIELLLK